MPGFRTLVLAAVASSSLLGGTLHAAPLVALDGKNAVHARLVADEEEAPSGKIWFAFFGGDYQKPILQDRAFLIDLVAFFFFEVGGAIWAPMLLAGASWDMEWVGPTLVWMAACWAFGAAAIVLCWTGVGLLLFVPSFIAAWIGTEVMLANLDRPEVKLTGDEPAEAEAPAPDAKKKKAPAAKGKEAPKGKSK